MTVSFGERVEFFYESGYLHMPAVVTGEELTRVQQAADRIIRFASTYRVPHENYQYRTDPDTGAETFYRLNYPKIRSVEFQALFGHPGLLRIYDELLGSNFVVIDDALVVKLPRSTTEFGWHRDTHPGASKAGESLLVPGLDLDVSNVANGCVHVVPGSHKNPDSDIKAMVAEHGFDVPGATPLESTPGDVLVHSGNTLHGSKPNNTDTTRRTVYIAAMDIDNYLEAYEATPDMVRLQLRYMQRAIQLRATLPYIDDEETFQWEGNRKWLTDIEPDDYMEWGIPAAQPRKPNN